MLKLYCQSLMPRPCMDVTNPGCTPVPSAGALQAEYLAHGSDIPAADQEAACHDGPDYASGTEQPTVECTNPSNLACNLLPAATPDGPWPLELSGVTIGELYEQVRH